MGAGQGKEDDAPPANRTAAAEMLPSGPVRPPERQGVRPDGWREMASDHQAAVGDAVEERLRPVPGCVEADGPPERAGAPQAEAEEETDEAGGEQAERRLAGIAAVAEAEDEGEDQRGGPEAERVGVLARRTASDRSD